ncbi:MAG: ribosome-associated GTPase EngA, partial [Gemmatimonadetes bacterium]|nr:ribosome-associated GTPase EngA [Gemmatimonadota bacterium]
FEKELRARAPFLQWVPFVFTSVLTGQRVQKVLPMILEVEEERNRRISTHEVNEVMRELVGRAKPPQFQGHSVKFLYGTQASVRPPHFVLFVNIPEGVPDSYQRFLHNGFRQHWGFMGVPLRITLRRRGEDEE